jgi:hypothetical protein
MECVKVQVGDYTPQCSRNDVSEKHNIGSVQDGSPVHGDLFLAARGISAEPIPVVQISDGQLQIPTGLPNTPATTIGYALPPVIITSTTTPGYGVGVPTVSSTSAVCSTTFVPDVPVYPVPSSPTSAAPETAEIPYTTKSVSTAEVAGFTSVVVWSVPGVSTSPAVIPSDTTAANTITSSVELSTSTTHTATNITYNFPTLRPLTTIPSVGGAVSSTIRVAVIGCAMGVVAMGVI